MCIMVNLIAYLLKRIMTSKFSTVDERGLNVSSTVMGSNQEYTIPALNWAPSKELLQRSSINSTPEGGWQSIQITQSTPKTKLHWRMIQGLSEDMLLTSHCSPLCHYSDLCILLVLLITPTFQITAQRNIISRVIDRWKLKRSGLHLHKPTRKHAARSKYWRGEDKQLLPCLSYPF